MKETKKYVKYYRVSTKKQGKSGLGLEAQKNMLADYPAVGEFVEVESGAKSNRPEFAAAAALAKKEKATLLVAKIDRLSRDFAFIVDLERAGIDFEIASLPGANRLTIHIMAAMAEQERELICARQKDAWAQRKARAKAAGKKIDFSHLTAEGRKKGNRARKEKAISADYNRQAYAYAQTLKKQGKSFNAIAKALNDAGFKTARNAKFYPCSVINLFKLFGGK